VLRFLFTEINYGGRVTDDKDRRLINSLILNFCAPEVLQDTYRFSASGTYYMPECETVKQVRHIWQAGPHAVGVSWSQLAAVTVHPNSQSAAV
jgi:hypothetical protein